MLKGIDISSWQGSPDFSKVKEDNIDFVIVKATEGVGFTDPQFRRNQAECRKLNIALGYYAFVRPDLGNSPEAEAEYFLETIGPLQEGELLFLDFEVDYANRVDWCKKWLDHAHTFTGIKAPIYLNKSLEKGSDWSPIVDADYGLWLADYTYSMHSTAPKTQWPFTAFRQYSNSEKIAGINGNVDGNVFYGDKAALTAYGYKGTNSEDDTCEDKLIKTKSKIEFLEKELNKKGDVISGLEEDLRTKEEAIAKAIKKANGFETKLRATNVLLEKTKKELGVMYTSRQELKDLIDEKLQPKIDSLKAQEFTVPETMAFLWSALRNNRW